MKFLKGSNGRLYTQPLRLCATTPFVVEMDSTIGRELWFCGLHAIHHYALARVILVKELGLKGIDDQFGVAPSTLVHREYRKESNRADVAVDALEQDKKMNYHQQARRCKGRLRAVLRQGHRVGVRKGKLSCNSERNLRSSRSSDGHHYMHLYPQLIFVYLLMASTICINIAEEA